MRRDDARDRNQLLQVVPEEEPEAAESSEALLDDSETAEVLAEPLSLEALDDLPADDHPSDDPEPRRPYETLLGRYFDEVAGCPMLDAEEEKRTAEGIETIEIDLWQEILLLPGFLRPLLDFLGNRLPEDLIGSRELAFLVRHHASYEKLVSRQSPLLAVAAQIRSQDLDREILTEVLAQLNDLDTSSSLKPRSPLTRDLIPGMLLESGMSRVRAHNARAIALRNRFVQANLRLVVSIARRYSNAQITFLDLVQEGNLGLIKAVGRYDHRLGYRFSTYASWWIRHAISRSLANKGRMVRLPVHLVNAQSKMQSVRRQLSAQLGRPPTDEEVRVKARLSHEKASEAIRHNHLQVLSLNRAVATDDPVTFLDLLEDPESIERLEGLGTIQMIEQVRLLLGKLKPIELDVLRSRYGLDSEPEQTLNEIGAKHQLSRERIRQIQNLALRKIRRGLQQARAI